MLTTVPLIGAETSAKPWTRHVIDNTSRGADGTRLAGASDGKNIQIWDLASGQEIARLRGHSGRVRAVAFSPDGALLASAAVDRSVRLWDLTSGAEVAAGDRSGYFERAPEVESIYQASKT